MKNFSLALVLLLAGFTIDAAAQPQSQPAPLPQQPVIRVTATGTASGQPDIATIQISVVTKAKTAKEAADENARIVTNVLAALRAAMGVGSSVMTVDYNLSPAYRQGSNGEQITDGFMARNSMRIETGEMSKVGTILDAAIAAGANDVSGVIYTVRNPSKLRAEALTNASREARSRAETLAAANGVKLAGVRLIEEASPSIMPMLRESAPTTPIAIGPVQIESTVTIVYDISR